MLKSLRNAFITGLIILLPIGVTLIILQFLIKKVGAPTSNLIFFFLDNSLRSQPWVSSLLDVASTLVVFLLITFLGFISRYFLGRILVTTAEYVVLKLPFINTVYNTVKQIVDTFSEQHKAVFQKAVLVEYPRTGIYALGFITSNAKGEVQLKTKADVLNIFVPTTPNPTSGFLLMVPKEEVIELDMSIADCMKLVISGGAVVPKYNIETQQPSIEGNA